MSEQNIYDVNLLLLPVESKIGATNKVKNLIEEMTHPNIDWKYVVTGIRSYLYDYLYEIPPHGDKILPIIYYYLKEATFRRKGSSLRASDTFFDRYIFIIKKAAEDGSSFAGLKGFFDDSALDYFELLMQESREGFYFDTVNERALQLGELLIKGAPSMDGVLGKLNAFLALQYRIHVGRSILAREEEINLLEKNVTESGEAVENFFSLLKGVSENVYGKKIGAIESAGSESPARMFEVLREAADFSHNARSWEKISLGARSLIENGIVTGDRAVLELLAYLVKKAQEGDNRDTQLFMSRTVASVCSVLGAIGKMDLLKDVVDLVMPALLSEIERGGNYYSAFATILNIGKTVIESQRLSIIDHFIEILVQSKFCFPEFSGIASDWSVIVNSSHLENIRTWMRLIEINPPQMRKLAASLIVNLKLGGVFLKDTDVFQRDISRLLNSNYRDVFYLVISLASVFPAFYHDIGATGDIRAFTEKIDTNHQMNDLIHFVRKQVHVESSSRTVLLIQDMMEFWMTGDQTLLKNMVPADVYGNLDRAYRLINFDSEKGARKIFDEAKRHFGREDRFWDFLNAVGKKGFMDFVESATFEGISGKEKSDAINCFREYFDDQFPAEMTKMLHHIQSMFDIDISKTKIWTFLYEIPDDDFRKMFEDVGRLDISRVNIEKFITFLHVYRMIFDKYNFSDVRAIEKLENYAKENLFAPADGFFEHLKGEDVFAALDALLDLQQSLKRDILLSEKSFDPVDTIEFKRHIAFGIPSMYGSYKERKFDTLKVFFHTNLIRVRLFETMVESMSIFPHERIDYDVVKRVLKLFFRSFEIDGLSNHEMRVVISLLGAPNLNISQLRDVTTTLLTIYGEISDKFNETYKHVCKEAINNIGLDRIIESYIPYHKPQSVEIVVDRFLRNQIMQSPLLQMFDNLLIRLRDYLNSDLEIKGDIICLNKRDSRVQKGDLVRVLRMDGGSYGEIIRDAPLWEVGAKAQGLMIVALDGLNVPEGVVISSEFYKRVKDGNIRNPRFQRKLIHLVRKYVDAFTGGRFANPDKPLLLSVRSGAPFSLPGVMNTITNVGMTDDTVEYFAQKDGWFAWDCYRRLIHDFAISLYSMDRHVFERLMAEAKEEAGVDLKEKLSAKQMELLTKKYRFAINKEGHSVPKDPYEQLFYAILSVFQSWESAVAQNYREFIKLSGGWGTSVIMQNMVFGNLSPSSITGVVHSLYMGYEDLRLFGEYKTRAQGHDIVSGIARVFPISEEQRFKYAKSSFFPSLEKTMPGIYRMVYDAVKKVRERWENEIEIEFTVEDGVLYILQIRGMTNHIFEIEELAESHEKLQEHLLGQGLAASGGAIAGRAVFAINRIDEMRKKFPIDKIILVRPETNPEDVIGLKKSDGILTCIGGMTSHAVLQMRRLEKSGVSDFSLMKVDERNNMGIVNRETNHQGKVIIREGDFITIDGSTGHVYLGSHKTRIKTL